MRFLALGDSYTIGESVAESQRWPAHLRRLLQDRGVRLSELTYIARTGWTTDELQAGILQASPASNYDLVSLLIGVNNQYRGLSQREYKSEFVSLLKQAISFAGGEPHRVLTLSIPDWSVTPFAEDHDRAKVASEINAFNAINRSESERLGAHYLDVTPISRRAASDSTLLAADGLHPSGNMYEQWADLVLPVALSIIREN